MDDSPTSRELPDAFVVPGRRRRLLLLGRDGGAHGGPGHVHRGAAAEDTCRQSVPRCRSTIGSSQPSVS
ncbi:hypothetical protein GUJ93_ZPchr0012g19215 [Zizania palustris]|uniref:Uncharacterized protein n=1 Tax=Zizania palustris TaxID=103762 RepID=A0A8J5WJ62_ZIZPA|nr:hypothetical protein GUJ93_ZPchr0012g19215 [Zizania palustris]